MAHGSEPDPQQDAREAAPDRRVISERVARAAARALLAANKKAGIEPTAKTRDLASRPRI